MLQWISYSSLIPPSLFILLGSIGIVLAWRWRRAGLIIATAGVGCLYLCSMPVVAGLLILSVDKLAREIPTLPLPAPPGAIIVLSAEYRHSNRPGAKDIVGPVTLERLAEAVREHRRTNLPILVSGGWLKNADDSLAGMMAASLQNDFQVPVQWREERSRTTYENALYSAAILRRAGISSALVVTNPWHMARALWSFYVVGYPVVPAVVPEGQSLELLPSSFFPQVPALVGSYYALHELVGLAWYVLHYGNW